MLGASKPGSDRRAAGVLLLCGLALPCAGQNAEAVGGHSEHMRMPLMLAPFELRSPAFRLEDRATGVQIFQVNVDGFGQNIVGDAGNEPSIAIDPTAPNRVVVGWRQFDTILSDFRQAGYGVSRDGGRTWSGVEYHERGIFRSDPVLMSERDGSIVYLSLCGSQCGEGFTTQTFITDDGGLSWTGPHFAYGGDKAWLAMADRDGAPDGFGFQAWSTAQNQWGAGLWSRTFDGGLTWSVPNRYVPWNYGIRWGEVALGPDGEAYVIGTSAEEPPTALLLRSDNASDSPDETATFVRGIANAAPGRFVLRGQLPNPGGLNNQLELAVDTSDGAGRGNVYLVAPVVSTWAEDQYDLAFLRSTDRGVTWSDPIRINPPPHGEGIYHWFATLGIAPNGRLDVVWNTNALLPALPWNARTFYTSSSDQGQTWSTPIAVGGNWDSWDGWPVQQKIGDYYDMVSDDVGCSVAFAATWLTGSRRPRS
jgi:hypothetical protein